MLQVGEVKIVFKRRDSNRNRGKVSAQNRYGRIKTDCCSQWCSQCRRG